MRKTTGRVRPSIRSWRIIATNGRVARPRRDEDVGPLVIGQEHELALRADHPHAVTDRQAPQQRGECPTLDESHVELVAVRAGDRRRRGDRIRALHDLALDHDPDRHVLAALEGGRIAVEPDPEVGERLVLVLASDERGVVLRRLGIDEPGVGEEVSHVRMVPGARGAAGCHPALTGVTNRPLVGARVSRSRPGADR